MRRAAADVTINLLLLLAYFAAAKLGLMLAVVNESATAVWPPTGIALAAVLLLGRRVCPAIWLGALLANYTTSHRIVPCAAIATGNLLEALVGAALVTRFANGRHAFDRAGDIFRFALYAGVIGTAVSATIGTTALALAGLATQRYASIWLTWFLGDLVSALTVAPLLIIWLGKRLPRDVSIVEALMLLCGLCAIALIVFGPVASPRTPIGYFAILPLLWAAFRFHQHGASLGLFVVAIVAVWGTLNGTGPFAVPERNQALLFLQTFLATISVTALVLASIVAERQTARREAEMANRAKDNFLAVLSHELRTPLTPALLTATLLEQQGGLSPQVLADVQMIRRNIELEARLIDDLLDVTRIARGKLQLNIQTTDVHEAVRGAIKICLDGRANLGADLSAADATVRGDPARLHQVFWNLLSNAHKFTPAEGTIIIRSCNPQPGKIRVEVRDTGMGIDPQLLPKLFTAFEQGGIDMGQKSGGLGLGLAISKALVSAHGGTLTAVSAGKDRGATFTVEFPTQKHNPPHAGG